MRAVWHLRAHPGHAWDLLAAAFPQVPQAASILGMKVRWTHESLRVRITPAELDTLVRGGDLTTALGGWTVQMRRGGEVLGVQWDGPAVTVQIPGKDLETFADEARDGVYAHQTGFRLLVEKDYPCRHPHPEEAREPATERFPWPASDREVAPSGR